MKCWICGAPANTGEHKVKASDLKAYFGQVSQKNPIYTQTAVKKNIPIGSIKANKLKFKGSICNNCNSSLTQPHDKAWEKLSRYLQKNWEQLQKANKIELSKVFSGAIQNSMLNVHLFFVKLFGCAITEHSIPIELSQFSKSLLENKPHPYIHIAFLQTPCFKPTKKLVAVTPIQALNVGDRCVFCGWMYIVGNVTVQIIYNEVPGNPALNKTWNPLNSQKAVVPIKII